jgi:orotate phosphoribosyltransferase
MAADQLKLPFIYVRPKPKEHGLGNQIEGDVQPGQKMVVVEDLISTGKSSLQAVDALLEKGVEVVGLVSIFNYGFPIAQQEFEKRSIKYYSLTNYTELLSLSLEKGIITEAERSVLEQWRKNPAEWGK